MNHISRLARFVAKGCFYGGTTVPFYRLPIACRRLGRTLPQPAGPVDPSPGYTTVFVRVKGDAMVGVGIHDGDLVVVDRAPAPADQQVIVAILGDTCTIRRLELLPGSIVLYAAHPAYLPLDVTHRLDFHVWGIVSCVIHPLLASMQGRFGSLGS